MTVTLAAEFPIRYWLRKNFILNRRARCQNHRYNTPGKRYPLFRPLISGYYTFRLRRDCSTNNFHERSEMKIESHE